MDKGDRVQITGGRQGKGKTGTIFWKGPNKYGGGDRFGVRGDDGETYWVSSDDVESSQSAEPQPDPGHTFSKGDRVKYTVRGQRGIGSVFWIGESRSGPGQRLGVRPDDAEEAVWLDARQAELLDETEASSAAVPSPHPGPARGASDAEWEDESDWSPAVGLDEMPAPPPMDDSAIDGWSDDDEEPPPADW